jgi:nitroreductase
MKSFLKKAIPTSFLKKIRSIQYLLGIKVGSVASKSKFLSNLFYSFSHSFSQEHHAVLKGKQAYHESLKDIGETCALLRRNTHRLEKGLIMRPRRSVFAEGFIQETVDCYKNAITSNELAQNEKKWASDVLDEYFRIVGATKVTAKARIEYEESRSKVTDDFESTSLIPAVDSHFKPYTYAHLPEPKVSVGELEKLFVKRRSVRWYQDKPVPKALVQQAANLASLAPSACNRQPYRFVFCNDKDKAVAIAKCAGGTIGFAENLPSIIAVVGDLSAYPYERDRHLIYVDGALGSMQLMLALETLELSSCSINWPEVDASERKIRKIIDLKGYERVVMLLAVGYAEPEGGIPFSQKKMNKLILEDIS